MSWKTFWTWIGIIYPAYYVINIAYDLYMHNKKRKQEGESTVYDVGAAFDHGIKPTVVILQPVVAPVASSVASKSNVETVDFRELVETQRMTVQEFLAEARSDSSNLATRIFG